MIKPHGCFKSKLGEKHFSNQGEQVEILEYFGWKNCTIIFPNEFILKNVQYSAIVDGRIKNPYFPSICNIGFVGVGKYKPYIGNTESMAYKVWNSMLSRCYRDKYKSICPTYINCSVHTDWHNFQNFAKWFYANYIENWHLDKDILVKGNKIYSPKTCCFVPIEINSLFVKRQLDRGDNPIGVTNSKGFYISRISMYNKREYIGIFKTKEDAFNAYKIAKELYIKDVAEKWKNKITNNVYSAMLNYEVEITD